MKIRYWVILYTVFMLVVMAALYESLAAITVSERDMVYYNEQMKLVEQELEQMPDRSIVEQNYSCEIIFLTDEDYVTRLNECMQERAVIFDYYVNGEIAGKVAWNEERQSFFDMKKALLGKTAVLWGIILCCGYCLLAVIYIYFIRPFQELQNFSARIAKGNLDIPLPMHKHNFFGAFTESFDIMREELKRAKESEYQANRSKKELIAELSHDIKTPIATIKATCEVLQVKEHNPDTLEKLEVIAAKADTVDHLIENMFHSTLEELKTLKVEATEENSLCLMKMVTELNYYDGIVLTSKVPECLVYIDKLRLEQVINNIIDNSYKYAGTDIAVAFREREDGIEITFCDAGPGMPEEEISLITEKFYRGSNAKGKDGSGLGLYLSKLFMEQMQGGLECYIQDGFAVKLFIKKV